MKIFTALLLLLVSCANQLAGPAIAGATVKTVNPKAKSNHRAVKPDSVKDEPSVDGVPPMVEVEEFDAAHIRPLIAKFQDLDSKKYPYIVVRINSYGGSIHWGMQLIQAMEALNAKTVCIVDWRAMSMGAYLLESGACDVRLMTKRSVILFHEPLVSGVDGNSHQLQDIVDQLKALAAGLIATASDRLKMSEKDFAAKIDNKAWTMSYQEALDSNVVDGLFDPALMPPLIVVPPLSFMQLL